jgi:hypothetical protein
VVLVRGKLITMSVSERYFAVVRHSMRAYYVAIVAGLSLVVSAFLPWGFVGDSAIGGVPDVMGWWVFCLGVLAVVLASLSVLTRKNSRHPLLVVGLLSLGIIFLAHQLMTRTAEERVWVASQASSIVRGTAPATQPKIVRGAGIFVGSTASIVLALFGLTIVVKRGSKPYYVETDDDV